MFPCFKRKYKKKKKKKGDLYKYMYTTPIESNNYIKKKKERKALYLNVNLVSTKVLIGDTIFFTSPTGDRTAILRGHPSHVKVDSFAGQGMYLHFSVILRPGVLVRPRESNPRPSALQSSALPTELTLPRVPFVFLRSFRSVPQ